MRKNTESKEDRLLEEGEEYLKKLGPGVVSGAADDDPSGIATYSQTGASYGTSLSWLALWTLPLMVIIQEMCARISLVTGRGLASNIKHLYPRKILYICTILLFIANTINIGADLGAMAKSFQLLSPSAPFWLLILGMGGIGLILEIFVPYKKYSKYLKWLVISLFSYIITGLIINMNWYTLLKDTFIPSINFSKDQILLIVGILGTTISPYLFFWQTSQEIEEEIVEGKTTIKSRLGSNKKEINQMRVDVWAGMLLSNLVMFFIIAVCANTLFTHGITNIETAEQAALALKPFAGHFAFLLFATGIIGTGLLAIPVLAGSASYAISESLGWHEGLYRKFKQARAFYIIIAISIIIGIIINFIGINPMKALIYSAILNGIVAPVIIICIVGISSNRKVMGDFKNSLFANIVGWLTVAIMTVTSVMAIVSIF